MRQRLTTRIAEDLTVKSKGDSKASKGSGIDNDVYNMNDTGHEGNDPKREMYAKGDPSAWGEDVYTKPVNSDDQKREETGHAPLVDKHAASEAIATVRMLEEKAARCIVASQRCLPGADREMIEAQAASFMHLPDDELNATLSRQEKLAQMFVQAAEDVTDEAKDEAKDEKPKDEKPKDEGPEAEEPKEAEAGKKVDDDEGDEEIPAFLKKKLASLEAEIATLKQAAKAEEEAPEGVEEKPEEKKEEKAEDKKEEKPEGDEVTFGDEDNEVSASDDSLLDQIFSTVTASADKKGARTLSGLVKKEASTGAVGIDAILMEGVPPSVNHLFQ